MKNGQASVLSDIPSPDSNKSKFNSDFYTECKLQIYANWINHFKGKESQDATSFMTNFENLTIKHVSKAAEEAKLSVEQQESKLFAWHMRDELIDLNFMSGDLIEMWKSNGINELSKMKETVKSFFNLTELNKYLIDIGVVKDPNVHSPLSEEDILKQKISKYASCWFNILEILIKQRFFSTGDATHSEHSYLNQLSETIEAHSKNDSTNKDDIEVIKSDPHLNEMMLHICKQLQVICVDDKNNLEFNTTEIDNVAIGYKKEPELLLKRVTHFS